MCFLLDLKIAYIIVYLNTSLIKKTYKFYKTTKYLKEMVIRIFTKNIV